MSETVAETMRGVINKVLPGETRRAWRTVAAAVFALPPEPGEQKLFEQCTGRSRWPTSPVTEVYLIVGRRGGKSEFTARLGAVLANFRDYRDVLAPGEIGIGMIVAADRRQARVVKDYCAALCRALPGNRVTGETLSSVELVNNLTIEIGTRSVSGVRGRTVVFAIAEELAFWPSDEAANPDTEVLNALRPAMATVPDGLLMCISSPYARRGELWRAHRQHYGTDGDVLVWEADTLTMNASVPVKVIDQAFARDEAVAWSEFGRDGRIEFRRDVDSFISREALEAAVIPGRLELAPRVAA